MEALARVLRRQDRTCLLTVSPDQETRLSEWLRGAHLPPHIGAVDQTGAYACLELHGPRRVRLDPGVARGGLWRRGGRGCGERLRGAHHPERGRRLRSGGASWCSAVICAVGWAVTSPRKHYESRGVPRSFGREITRRPSSASWVPMPEPAAMGVRAPRAPRRRRFHERTARESSRPSPAPMTSIGFGAHDVILEAGHTVGELSSRVRLPGWPATLALGLLDESAGKVARSARSRMELVGRLSRAACV